MPVEVLTLVNLSYEKQTKVQKIFCVDFTDLKFVYDFAVRKDKDGRTVIFLLQKKPGMHSLKEDYSLVVLQQKSD
jgi:hypothetical protein